MEDLRGDCFHCNYYDEFENYCGYYKIFLNGIGFEPTCNNPELVRQE